VQGVQAPAAKWKPFEQVRQVAGADFLQVLHMEAAVHVTQDLKSVAR